MARGRIHGSDVPFMAWCRSNPHLPAAGQQCGWVQTDVDAFIHRYLHLIDGVGTRELQAMMEVEVKTWGAMPSPSQEDTLRKKHLTTRNQVRLGRQVIRNFGVTVVSMDATTPDDSSVIKWCRFRDKPPHDLIVAEVTAFELVELLRFDRNPDTLEKNWLRRHHATRRVVEKTVTPLGLEVEQLVVWRS